MTSTDYPPPAYTETPNTTFESAQPTKKIHLYGQAAPTYDPAFPAPVQFQFETTKQSIRAPLVHSADEARPSSDHGRFDYATGEYRDIGFLFAFVLHLVGIFVIAGAFWRPAVDCISNKANCELNTGGSSNSTNSSSTHTNSSTAHSQPSSTLNGSQALQLLLVSAFVGVVVGIAFLVLARRFSKHIIEFSMALYVLMMALVVGSAFFSGSAGTAIVCLLLFILTLIFFYSVRRRIPFAAAMLSVSSSALSQRMGTVWVTLGMAVLQVVWVGVWSFAVIGIYAKATSSQRAGLYLLLALSFYWTLQVLRNVAHVTTAGTIASWWCTPGDPDMCKNAFRRATTTSLGSICFGSLIVAALEVVRNVLRAAAKSGERRGEGAAAILFCCLECLVAMIERLMEYFNFYAFIQVAIYGKDFLQAARDTWGLIKNCGFDAVINDDLSGLALWAAVLAGAGLTGVLGGVWTAAAGVDNWLGMALLAALVGGTMTGLVMSVVQSAVATTFVMWAEDVSSLRTNRPHEWASIESAAQIAYPGKTFIL